MAEVLYFPDMKKRIEKRTITAEACTMDDEPVLLISGFSDMDDVDRFAVSIASLIAWIKASPR